MEIPKRRHLRISTLTGSYKGLWEQLRVTSPIPPRRCNHSAVVIKNKLFLYGGQDISEGVLSDTWMLELNEGSDEEKWYKVKCFGETPGPLCRHGSLVYKNMIYIIGGNDGYNENAMVYTFDIENSSWTRNSAIFPGVDSHTTVLYDNKAIIFGGYQGGFLTNCIYKLDLDTMQYTLVDTTDSPCVRAYHTAVVYKNYMWIYGGISNDSYCLQDMWKLNLESFKWEEISFSGDSPGKVSGHSACVYGDVMLVFGGVRDVLKETNEMYTYDFIRNTWVLIQSETDIEDPVAVNDIDRRRSFMEVSPTKTNDNNKKKKNKKSLDQTENFVNKIYSGPPATVKGRVKGRIPYSRDGHSATLYDNYMIIFGGDRHQMAFNDIYLYSINERLLRK
jgi:Kelch motif/Galactose oxidase, central domain